MAITVAEWKPAYDVSDNHGRSSNCIYCQRFGSAAQCCGHIPLLGLWDPVGTGRLLDKQIRVSPLRGEVSEEAVGKLEAVVPANESAFVWEGAPPGRSSRMQHHINAGEPNPLPSVSPRSVDSDSWRSLHNTDPELELICKRLPQGAERPTIGEMASAGWEAHCIWTVWSYQVIWNRILYYQHGPQYNRRNVVPQSTVQAVMSRLHQDLGHAGQLKMEDAMNQSSWRTQRQRGSINFCNHCTE
ncbi:hypothetical protein PHET_08416 [Paragonimus heterotremus]|uniref:Integrase zinc-binding domain-containing protein n=1 Tax=Paragonimus heterotremus TaxID=100268 RepID=A0A8J4WVM4_9TREM|nr:hypothetical protein PHET_08416 [Paragonimus heterotremus]